MARIVCSAMSTMACVVSVMGEDMDDVLYFVRNLRRPIN